MNGGRRSLPPRACPVLLDLPYAMIASSNKCSIHVVVTSITFLLIFCHLSFLPVCRSSYSEFTTQIFDMIQDMSSATALLKITSPARCRAISSALKRLSLLLFLLARSCLPTLYLNEYTPFGLSRRNCRVQFVGISRPAAAKVPERAA